jgi:hypothetical protein
MIDISTLIEIGFTLCIGFILWDQHKQRENMAMFQLSLLEMIDKHNQLADVVVELDEALEEVEEAIQ